MNKEEILSILRTYPHEDNLEKVIGEAAQAAIGSTRFILHERDESEAPHLTGEHYYKGFTMRMKNPNGVAKNTPGLPESVTNFSKYQGKLKLMIAELDKGSQISMWLSEKDEIVGCFLHPKKNLINNE